MFSMYVSKNLLVYVSQQKRNPSVQTVAHYSLFSWNELFKES